MHQVSPEPVGLAAQPRSPWRADVGGLLRRKNHQGLLSLWWLPKRGFNQQLESLAAAVFYDIVEAEHMVPAEFLPYWEHLVQPEELSYLDAASGALPMAGAAASSADASGGASDRPQATAPPAPPELRGLHSRAAGRDPCPRHYTAG